MYGCLHQRLRIANKTGYPVIPIQSDQNRRKADCHRRALSGFQQDIASF